MSLFLATQWTKLEVIEFKLSSTHDKSHRDKNPDDVLTYQIQKYGTR